MSIGIKLDRRAVLQLIEEDPEFKLELQQSVISEVVTKLFEKDVRKILEVGDKALLKQIADAAAENGDIMAAIQKQVEGMLALRTTAGYWSKSIKVSAEVQALIDEAVANAKATINARINGELTDAAKQAVETALAENTLDERIEKRTKRLLDEEINRRVDTEVRARLAKIAQGITA